MLPLGCLGTVLGAGDRPQPAQNPGDKALGRAADRLSSQEEIDGVSQSTMAFTY